jgi:UDP-N-acetylmuramoyl-L-alanyl-D-glutamate--2,6-diaminopimelate ligase
MAGPGDVFFALAGAKSDGAAFAADAVRRGAVAVVHAGGLWEVGAPGGAGEIALGERSARAAMGRLAGLCEGEPSRRVRVVGVTGTNGKTTTTFLLRALLRGCGMRAGLVGTVVYDTGARVREAARTTPESPDIQRLLAEAAEAGTEAVAMEVSSQGLAAERASGVRFAATGFTNLTRDHLDFHGSMEAYFAAKRRLFAEFGAGAPAAVNADDAWGRRLAEDIRGRGGEAVTFGVGESARADVRAERVRLGADGSVFDWVTPWGRWDGVRTGLAGGYNLSNALAALTLGRLLGADGTALASALEGARGAPGRLERVADARGGRRIFVDYAHTDDALENVLSCLRATCGEGRLICVFGCGGNRDRGKRPRMGEVASRLADVAVLTSDNPRDEEPEAIIRDVLEGIPAERRGRTRVVADRRQAIGEALAEARPGDTVVVAGKGHEKGQTVKGVVLPFDDVEVVREWLGGVCA